MSALLTSAGLLMVLAVLFGMNLQFWRWFHRHTFEGQPATTIPHPVTPQVVGGITDATAVTTDNGTWCELHRDGTISCWGSNRSGELAGETTTTSLTALPAQKVAGITDATAITSGGGTTCAVHRDGTVSCWEFNEAGQLGSGAVNSPFAPQKVIGITDATAVTRSWGTTCVLHRDGTVSCWGSNEFGQLGDGTTDDSSTPQKVIGITDATAISTSMGTTCVLHRDGTVSCWGSNGAGELGNGTTDDSSTPQHVIGITDATAITAGVSATCALHRDGRISCWGSNEFGQLGDGTTDDSSTPQHVPGITDATAITADNSLIAIDFSSPADPATAHGAICALHRNGTISCWP